LITANVKTLQARRVVPMAEPSQQNQVN